MTDLKDQLRNKRQRRTQQNEEDEQKSLKANKFITCRVTLKDKLFIEGVVKEINDNYEPNRMVSSARMLKTLAKALDKGDIDIEKFARLCDQYS